MRAVDWYVIVFELLSLMAAFGAGYAHASVKYHRRLANGYRELSTKAALGHIPRAEEVIRAFGGEVLPDDNTD